MLGTKELMVLTYLSLCQILGTSNAVLSVSVCQILGTFLDSDSLFTKFYNKESVSKAVSIQT